MNYTELFAYNSKTGVLSWKRRDRSMFKTQRGYAVWNARYSGKDTGFKIYGKGGEPRAITINLKIKRLGTLCAHRIIWEMHNGAIAKGMQIDHINGDPFDNRLNNLRICSPSENMRNSRRHRINDHRVKGVSWDKHNKKWQSEIRTDVGRVFLGRHGTKGMAAVAYAKASLRYHGAFSPFAGPGLIP